jgi:predicted CopG family antitoxin
MHNLCMPTKTISLRIEAYEKLKRVRRYKGESFSEIVLRARWPEETITGKELLERYRERGPFFDFEELDRIERLKRDDRPPEDKWAGR